MRWEICGDRYFEMGRGLKKEKKSHVHKYLENNVVTDFFFNWDSLHAMLNSHHETYGYKKKRHKKIKTFRESV